MHLSDLIVRAKLELPDVLPRQRTFHVQGWLASRVRVESVAVEGAGIHELTLLERRDVAKAYPRHRYCVGFTGVVAADCIDRGWLTLRVNVGGWRFRRTYKLREPDATQAELKQRKLERILPLLLCIGCKSRLERGGFPTEASSVRCSSCGSTYDCSQGCFDLLPPEARSELAADDQTVVSMNGYDESAMSIIRDLPDGIILDCGAGLRATEYPNVVNLDIFPYRSTDVLGLNERLPFGDAAFDAVLSLATLEHVRNPFACAREILRVLKPGGTLLCIAPLLAPVHGFPNHYYNMTSQGLANLFGDDIEIIETTVPTSGLPIWALVWILRTWTDALPGVSRERFANLRIRDLLAEAPEFLDSDFVTALSEEANLTLASTTLLRGRKHAGNERE